MSLDVYLTVPGTHGETRPVERIFVREAGSTREITRAEWDGKFPGCEPVTVENETATDQVFTRNITHNLGKMAYAAGLYAYLWRPDENGITKAGQLIDPLNVGLVALVANPDKFKAFNPGNGWGSYEGLVEFVREYLEACRTHPDANVSVSR